MMKYPMSNTMIPFHKREEINQKILHIIATNHTMGIQPTDVYQAYTGEGGLHGLQRSDYRNYHEYSEAKKEREQGQFFTPHSLCQFLVDILKPGPHDLVADLTGGMGNFINFLPVESNVYMNELDIKAYKVAKYLYPEAHIQCGDIRAYESPVKFDVILGNPPFNLKWKYQREEIFSQLFYCIKAADLLHPAGFLGLIMPSSFLQDEFMDKSMIQAMNERFSFVCQLNLPSNAFHMYGIDEFQTKVMIFQKRSEFTQFVPYSLSQIRPFPLNPEGAAAIHKAYIAPLLKVKEELKHKLFFERLQENKEEEDFSYRVKKTLFDIKRNPKLTHCYAKAVEYVNRFYTQEKPSEMKYEEWEEKRITKNKVLSYLKRLVSTQHMVERDEIRLVKTNYGLRLKGYSAKTRKAIKREQSVESMTFNEMVLSNEYPFSDRTYLNVWKRKVKAYEKQSPEFEGMERSPEIDSYLSHFSLYNKSTQAVIKLNERQKHDLGLVLQKSFSILGWQQGSGKSIAAMAWYKYLLEKKRVRNVFVVSAAIAIHLTWTPNLEHFSEDFIVIRSLVDIRSIKPGQIVLISLNMLSKYKRQIQEFIRMQSQKVALVMDESDELSNHRSLRTSATIACFRRVNYKLLTTGTTTRNQINEIYPQIELLYNNSINFLCDCPKIYSVDKEGEIVEEENTGYMKPFPAYSGLNLFKKCFSPAKITVFGVKKHNQNIYNKDSLTNIIRKTVINRKFQDIVGKKIHEIIPHRIHQNEAEREVYGKIIDEFHEMMHYFRSTGHSAKDSMLRIIRQIQLLIKSTSSPQFFDEYTSSEQPNKVKYILDLVGSFEEQVAIGTVFVETADEYYRIMKEAFPDRPVFLIKGDVDFKSRNKIIELFGTSSNGILISTQQSLKSSVNIPTCNKAIIESLQWNLPKIEQYYFRFIRYNSTEMKEIHIVTYDNSIEQNLLALLMAKERINEYIKTLEFKDEAEIFDEYGIDIDILNDIMEKEYDENGKVRITWGEQKVS